MSKECFCGCGREIPLGRKRIGNVLGDRMRRDVGMLAGALARTPPPANAGVLAQLLAEGRPNLEVMTRYMHAEISRDDLDRDGLEAWMKRMNDVREGIRPEDEEAGEHGSSDLAGHASRAPAEAASARDPLDRLQTLSELRQTGALTDDEFNRQKTRILEDV